MSHDSQHSALDLDALDTVPVFPLPGVVLFPDALLPLHVFEPRYRAMLAHCLGTHRAMAVAMLEEPPSHGAGAGAPPFVRVAGVGVIEAHEPLEDGRANIVLRGIARADLEERPSGEPFRLVRARVRQDLPSVVSTGDRMALAAAATALVAELGKRANVAFSIPKDASAGVVADRCAAHLLADPAVRQAVLETRRLDERVRRITTELAMQHRFLLGQSGSVLH